MLDTAIVGATIIDGSGAPGAIGDVGIRDGRIVSAGGQAGPAREVIDATGRVVCPGFIDSHTHYDAQVFWDPTLSPSCYHGVTTVIGGLCGFSIAPLTPESGPYLKRMLSRVEGMPLETLDAALAWDWRSFGEFLSRIEGRIGINAGFFAGHSAIRRAVMGERAVGEAATGEDIAAMEALLDRSLAEGALGLSTTVSPSHNDYEGRPVPSRWAEREEFLALARVVGRHEGTGLELLPDLDFPAGVPELMADFSVAGGRPVNWNILIAGGRPNAAQIVARQLAVSDLARARGGEVIALAAAGMPGVYMNLASGVTFDAMPGLWREVFRLPIDERIALFRQPETRRQLARDAASLPDDAAMKTIAELGGHRVVSVEAEENRLFIGRAIGEIARERGCEPIDAMLDIAIADRLTTIFQPDMGGEDPESWALRASVWADDRTLVGASDAGAHLDLIDSFAFSTMVLGAGVRGHGAMSLEAAIHQLTGRQAAYFGLAGRGFVRPGFHADLVILDPATIARGPTYRRHDLPGAADYRLYADAVGIDRVLVNGATIVCEGQHTGAMAGAVLRSGRDSRTMPIDVMRRPPAALADLLA